MTPEHLNESDDVSLQFELRANPHPHSEQERRAVLANPGFGVHFTDHMAVATWTASDGWHDSAVVPYGPFSLDPATAVLHYAQEVFEGLKAYRHGDGSVWLFRPDRNARRMARSAQRLALPVLEAEDFLASIDGLWWPPTRPGCRSPPEPVRRRGQPLPAPVHVRLGGVPRGAGGATGHLLLHREPGRPVLRLRGEAGDDLDLHALHAGGAGRDRRGEVRRQLRGQPGRRSRRRPTTAATR